MEGGLLADQLLPVDALLVLFRMRLEEGVQLDLQTPVPASARQLSAGGTWVKPAHRSAQFDMDN